MYIIKLMLFDSGRRRRLQRAAPVGRVRRRPRIVNLHKIQLVKLARHNYYRFKRARDIVLRERSSGIGAVGNSDSLRRDTQ